MIEAFEGIPDLVTFVVSVLAGLISVVSFLLARRAERSSGALAMDSNLLQLREIMLSDEVRRAMRTVVYSPPIIRKAEEDYSPWSSSQTYLSDQSVSEAVQKGGASDLYQFTEAYATLVMIVSRMETAAPLSRRGFLAKRWRKRSTELYGHLNEILSVTREARHELRKFDLLWPLGQETLGGPPTLLSDDSIESQLSRLNKVRDNKNAMEVKLPS
ncbi:hypothetical protein [Nesterenkonia populi]|uniref:hypothetical protein n=1 Tax=Nesterenkonia populi TaxID=1591087 RepID=UPI0011BF4303|nr:hypothetical protein [Nesterenkonia populi]